MQSGLSLTSYSKTGYTKEDHVALSKVFRKLSDRGCKILLSNSNTEFIQELYSDFHIKVVSALRAINSNPTRRGRDKNRTARF